MFTILYTLAISAVLYLFGARLYDRRAGLLAAAMFAVFSTSYSPGHIQSLNTDCLMALPYAAGAYLLLRSRSDPGCSKSQRARFAFAGGALSGIAFQINPKGAFDLIFFAVVLIAARIWETAVRGNREDRTEPARTTLSAPFLFAIAVGGFVAGSLPFLAYIAASHSTLDYWRYVWEWGARYTGYYPASTIAASAVRFTAGYFALNDILLITLVFVAVTTINQLRLRLGSRSAENVSIVDERSFKSDTTLLIWFAVSYAAVAVGGRFYSHYFFQVLPSLCLIGARGLIGILAALKTRSPLVRRVVVALLTVGFLFTLIRFHGRSALLAIEWARGTKSGLNVEWYHELRNSEERKVAAAVRDLPDGAEAAEGISLEGIRAGGPRSRAVDGPIDYLYVWGYRPEIYYWSGLLPASRYLSAQPLTGVPADVQYVNGEHRSILDEELTTAAREQLVHDLNETRPRYVVDELGMFNADLSINSFAELSEFMKEYKSMGRVERFMIYRRRDQSKKSIQ